MSILSDKQIRELCTVPTFVRIDKVPQRPQQVTGAYFQPIEQCTFTHASEDELKRELTQGHPHSDCGFVGYRPLTDEEKANFNPMISPYVPGVVRARLRKVPYDVPGSYTPMGEEPNVLPHEPFEPHEPRLVVKEKIISYGTSSFGYDVRLSREFKIFTNINSTMIDPLDFDHNSYVDHEGDFCIVPPNSYILGKTIEWFDIPRDVMVVCVGKSTYARSGAIVNVTPIEPGFRGHIVIEVSNSTPLPLKIYADMGISQFLFFRGSEECEVSYGDRNGKYQGQSSIVCPIG